MDSGTTRDWLEREDETARADRALRLDWLASHYPAASGFLVSGGWLAKQLLDEAKYCYVYGQYLAVAILGVAFLERVLAAQFYAHGRNDLERARGSDLLEEALESGWCSQEEFLRFDRMRRLRNPLLHFRRPLAPDTLEARAVSQSTHPDAILEADAKAILDGVLHVLGKLAL
jgi:hypothetical protein